MGMVVHELAVMCGLNVPEAKAEKFSRLGTTFLVKRFDRIESRRIHFSSAMTMLGKRMVQTQRTEVVILK